MSGTFTWKSWSRNFNCDNSANAKKLPALEHSQCSSVTMRAAHQTFIVTGGDLVEQWHISRELKFKEHHGHTGPIVSILTVNAHSANANTMSSSPEGDGNGDRDASVSDTEPNSKRSDEPDATPHDDNIILYSASLDNTIRSWDPYDMASVSTMEETSSEISCMSHIPLAGLLVTGSDDGAVRFWNPSSGSTIMLRAHENTVSCMCMAHLQLSLLDHRWLWTAR